MTDEAAAAETTAQPAVAGRHDAFLSYSRRDGDAARRIGSGLEAQGKDVWLDVEDILGGADWRARIQRGIEACTAFVFLLSPSSLASEHCRQELELAVGLNKLIVPVLLSDVEERATPPSVADREWVFLREADAFDAGLGRLVDALETDLEWRDDHTRLAGRTREWLDAERDRSFLLRGAELREAELWLSRQAGHREQATGEQAEYILAGRRAAVAFQRRLLAAVGAGLAIAVLLAVYAVIQKNIAVDQKRAALSRGLTAESRAVLARDPGLAGILGIEANRLHGSAATRDDLLSLLPSLTNLTGTLNGLLSDGHGVAFSPDGATIAAASDDPTLPLWDVVTQRRIARLPGPENGVLDVAFSPDGSTLAYGGATDGRLYLWDAVDRTPRGAGIAAHSGPVLAVAFNRGGRILASAGSDGAVRLWDPARRRLIRDLAAGDGAQSVDALAFSVDGRTLASAGSDGDVRLWDVAGDTPPRVIRGRRGPLYAVALSPDGRTLAFGGEDPNVWLVDLADERPRARALHGHREPVRSLAFDPRTGRLASASMDDTVRLWDPADPAHHGAPLVGHRREVLDVAFSPDGSRLASSDRAGKVLLWDVSRHRPLSFVLGRVGVPVADVAFGRAATLVTADVGDGTLRVWDAAARTRLRTLETGARGIRALATTADGRTLACAGSDGRLLLWDLAAGEPTMRRLEGPRGQVRDMTFDDGANLAIVTDDALTLWDTDAEHPVGRTLDRRPGGFYSVAFSPDGRRLAYGDERGAIRLRAGTAAPARSLPFARGHTLTVYALAFSPDGHELASASLDQDVRLWDVARRAPLGPALAQGDVATAVAFSPDGRTIASGDQGSTVRLWDVATHRPIGSPLDRHDGYVNQLSFSHDGGMLASVGDDGIVAIWSSLSWNRDPRVVEHEICARARRNLSPQDWRIRVAGEDPRRTCPDA